MAFIHRHQHLNPVKAQEHIQVSGHLMDTGAEMVITSGDHLGGGY